MDWKEYVETDPKFVRPLETNHFRADATKAYLVRMGIPSESVTTVSQVSRAPTGTATTTR